MNFGRLTLSLLLAFLANGCRTLPERTSLYNEEVVLRVWDVLANYYGSEALFECELYTVHDGKIDIAKPYPISDITVVAHSLSRNAPVFFRPVEGEPDENQFVTNGTILRFHPSQENETLFVAWVQGVSAPPSVNTHREGGFRR